MLKILFKLPFYGLLYRYGFPRIFPCSYTVSVTYRCNSKCNTCRVYQRDASELSLSEYRQVFKSLGHSPYWVTFSGGEPSIREDFADIVIAFYDICRPAIINIPSNGILTDRIAHHITQICEHCRKSKIIVNLSLDAIGEQHDKIRNVPDNYTLALSTYRKLKSLTYKNLFIGIHSVISKFNIKNFTGIVNNLLNLQPDQYITEIAERRNELLNTRFDITPSITNYKSAVDFLIHRIKHTHIKSRLNRITQAFRIEYYTLVTKILRDEKQVIPCFSGINSIQIGAEGDVWTCCVKAMSVGNLRSVGYDFGQVWRGDLLKQERASIKNKECHCPLANAAYTNMLQDVRTLFRVFCRVFFGWWR